MLTKPYLLLELAPDRRKRKRQLGKVGTHVPLRSAGRCTDHTEIHSIVWMLRADRLGHLRYPIQVIHTDRPDFLLQSSDAVIGVEITEGVSPNSARMDHLRESEPCLRVSADDEVAFYYPRKAVPGEDKVPAEQLRQQIRDNLPGDGWCGDGDEDWAQAMAYFAAAKVSKFSKEGFSRHEQNWLLIYDNWDEPGRRVDLADIALDRTFHSMAIYTTFDRVLVLDGHTLASFTSDGFCRWGRPRHGR
ncbi:hypothetical protein NG726_14930 [Pseudomonas sp. MOB-449]|nr:hypothetical protein [Pseudomonas sp. MOB-449]